MLKLTQPTKPHITKQTAENQALAKMLTLIESPELFEAIQKAINGDLKAEKDLFDRWSKELTDHLPESNKTYATQLHLEVLLQVFTNVKNKLSLSLGIATPLESDVETCCPQTKTKLEKEKIDAVVTQALALTDASDETEKKQLFEQLMLAPLNMIEERLISAIRSKPIEITYRTMIPYGIKCSPGVIFLIEVERLIKLSQYRRNLAIMFRPVCDSTWINFLLKTNTLKKNFSHLLDIFNNIMKLFDPPESITSNSILYLTLIFLLDDSTQKHLSADQTSSIATCKKRLQSLLRQTPATATSTASISTKVTVITTCTQTVKITMPATTMLPIHKENQPENFNPTSVRNNNPCKRLSDAAYSLWSTLCTTLITKPIDESRTKHLHYH